MGLFGGGGFNPISAISSVLGGGGGGGGSSSMYSGGIGSSTGNTNAQTTTTNTDTKNEDRRLVIAEGGIGINTEGSGITMNIYGRDATGGAGYSTALNQTAPNSNGGIVAPPFDIETFIQDNKLALAGGAAVLLVVVAAFVVKGKK